MTCRPNILMRKKWLCLLAGAVFVLGLALVGGFRFATQLLSVESKPRQAEVLVVLGGGARERASRAAELFNEGAAEKIIVSGIGDTEDNRDVLVSKGVPLSAIELETKSKSTKENAEFSVPLLRRLGARRVILVTSWFHSRRALHCFQRYAPEIEFISLPTRRDLPKSHWPNKAVRSRILLEYVKLLYYWLRYGIAPV